MLYIYSYFGKQLKWLCDVSVLCASLESAINELLIDAVSELLDGSGGGL